MTNAGEDPIGDVAPQKEGLPERIAGRYVIKSLLGRGGFGAVYEGYDSLEDRRVAIKVIRSDATLDPRATRSRVLTESSGAPSQYTSGARRPATRGFGASTPGSRQSTDITVAFKDEFRLLTQLHHPNLAEVYDFGRGEGADSVYFTQELVDGPYLTDYFENASREAIVEIFVQLARALDYIHALGLVHEDIKPSNVLVMDSGGKPHAKLIDFGLARMLRQQPIEPNEEGELTLLGTPGFSAPEKVRGQRTDHRSDIYSLAATIYAAARNQRPFSSKSFQDALAQQLDWRPELAGVLLNRCGPVVAELVGRMLQPDPELRPQSARAIVLELLRRELGSVGERTTSRQDRAEFARVLVEHLPFVDRASHLDILLTRANEVLLVPGSDASSSRSGSRSAPIRTLVIEAPEGMGKARLMAEMRREIQLGGGSFVEGSCWTSDRSALGPFASIVLQVAAALGDGSETVARFADLLVLARDRGTDLLTAGRLNEFLIAAARERPYVIHLSELARGQEIDRIGQLAHALASESVPLLLCCTTVPHAKIGLETRSLAKDSVLELWSLRPFSSREMEEILVGVLGDSPSIKETVGLLDKLTGGHPLSFRETLRVLIEEQVLVRESDHWLLRSASSAAEELHKSLAQRSETRLDGLGVSAWEVASILYLVETPIDEDLLANLSDLRKERFRRTLERLEGEGLVLRNAASGRSLVSLAHESVREAVRGRYRESLDETRMDLASAIEDLDSHDPDLLFLRARLLDDAASGLESVQDLEASARTLLDASQPQLAAQVLDRMIRRLRRHGGPENLRRLLDAKLLLLREAPGCLDDIATESKHYETGVFVAEILQDHRAQSLFWLGLADRTNVEGAGLEVALDRLERAAEAATAANDRVLSLRIANRRAEALMQAGEIESAGHYSREAMEILDVPEASDVDVCQILGVRLRCLSLSGQLGEARRLHEMARPIAARVPVAQRGSYLSGLAFLAVLSGEPERSIPEMEAAVAQLRAANLPRLLLTPLHNLGDLNLRLGRFDAAADCFREAVALASVYGFESAVQLNRGFLGYALARLGDVQQGATLLSTSRAELSRRGDDLVTLQQIRLLDAEVAHIVGNSARARRELEEMLADFHAGNEVALAQWAQDALARIERDLGHGFIAVAPEGDDGGDPDVDTVRTKPIR